MKRMHAQSGSVFFLILVGIALFAALSYAMIQGGRSSTSNLSDDQARLAAQEILSNAEAVGKAVQTLRLRGCTESQINFKTSAVSHNDFDNPAAPADGSCDVYDANAGKVAYYFLSENYHDSANFPYLREWVSDSSASYDVIGTPTKETDLVYYIYELKKDVCVAINKNLGISLESDGDVSVDSLDSWWKYFDGTFRTASNSIGDDTGVKHAGHTTGCFKGVDGSYSFYSVLIAR